MKSIVSRVVLVTAAIGSSFALAGASAQAAPAFHCEASPLRATILGSTPIEPVVQGRDGACATGEAIPTVSLPSLLNASVLTARTAYDGAAATGAATGGLAGVEIAPSPEILAMARQQVVDAINALPLAPITIPGLPALPIPGLPQVTGVTIDLKQTLLNLIPSSIPSLLSADVLTSNASVTCQAGVPTLAGNSTITGLKVLGQDLGVDGVVSTVLPLLDSRSISLASLDVSQLAIYDQTGVTPILFTLLDPILAQVRTALSAIPPIEIPAALAQVTVTPREQTIAGGTLTQRALRAFISLGGQPILDATIGEAKAGAASDACVTTRTTTTTKTTTSTVAGQGSVSDQLLACSDRKLILVDVLKQDGKVKLIGAANRDYVGKKVAIRLRRGDKVVAHAVVKKDGSFETTAPLPPAAVMASHKESNTLRYRAEIGKELSLPLKLQRRLTVSTLKQSSDGKTVKITGRVIGPLTTPVSDVRVVRRVSCRKVVLVKRFKPNANGTFSVSVPAPKGQSAAVYRLATSVREKASNPRSYPTFTLPRGVALNTR
ncbi:hypothetical protein [Baekduia sp. Peel2402]|uniref:hypothetical protein n=1 Tax=Baekduia sp. Peel2402 TaxID=3458296 RepID=UPI00403E47B7